MNSGGTNFTAKNIFCDNLNAGAQTITTLDVTNLDISGTLEFTSQDTLDTFSVNAELYSGTNSLVTKNTIGTDIAALDKNGNFAALASIAAPIGRIPLVTDCYQIDNGSGTINLGTHAYPTSEVYLNDTMVCGYNIQLATRLKNLIVNPFVSNPVAASAQVITLDTGPTQFNMVSIELNVQNPVPVNYINFLVSGINPQGHIYIYDIYYWDQNSYTYTSLLVTGKMLSYASPTSMYFYFEFNIVVPIGTILVFSLLQNQARP